MDYQHFKIPYLRSMCRARDLPGCRGSHYINKHILIELLEENDRQTGGQAGIIQQAFPIEQAPIVSPPFVTSPLYPITQVTTFQQPISPLPAISPVTTFQQPILPLPAITQVTTFQQSVSPAPQQIPISSLNTTIKINMNTITLFNNVFRNRPWSEVELEYGDEIEIKRDYMFWLSLSDEAKDLINDKIRSFQGPIIVNISFTAK